MNRIIQLFCSIGFSALLTTIYTRIRETNFDASLGFFIVTTALIYVIFETLRSDVDQV